MTDVQAENQNQFKRIMHVLSVGNCFHRYFLSFYIELHNKQVTFYPNQNNARTRTQNQGHVEIDFF